MYCIIIQLLTNISQVTLTEQARLLLSRQHIQSEWWETKIKQDCEVDIKANYNPVDSVISQSSFNHHKNRWSTNSLSILPWQIARAVLLLKCFVSTLGLNFTTDQLESWTSVKSFNCNKIAETNIHRVLTADWTVLLMNFQLTFSVQFSQFNEGDSSRESQLEIWVSVRRAGYGGWDCLYLIWDLTGFTSLAPSSCSMQRYIHLFYSAMWLHHTHSEPVWPQQYLPSWDQL